MPLSTKRQGLVRYLLLATLFSMIVAAPRVRTDERILSVKDVMRRVAAYVDAYGERGLLELSPVPDDGQNQIGAAGTSW
jgi:hypothetical protein